MAQEKQTPVDVTKNTPVRQPLSHKGFYTLLLTALLGMFIFVSYYASQQTQIYQSSAKTCKAGYHQNANGDCVKNTGGGGGGGGGTASPTPGGGGTGGCRREGGQCGSLNSCCSGLTCKNNTCVSSGGGGGGGSCTSITDKNTCNNKAGCKYFLTCNKCDSSSKGNIEVCGGTVTPTSTPTPTPATCDAITDRTTCSANTQCYWFTAGGGFCGASCDSYTDEASCTAGSCGWNSELQCCGGGPNCTSGGGGGGGGGGGTGTPTPTGGSGGGGGTATFNLSLSFQGITTTPVSGQNSMNVLVTLAGGPQGQNIPATGTFTVNSSGKWTGQVSFNGAAAGSGYKLLVKGPKHLQKKVCDSTPTETSPGTYHCGDGNITVSTSGVNTVDFSGIKLLVGDLPAQDGIVDSYDISLVRNGFCTTANPDICHDSTLLSQADLNLDGIIDSQDYSLLISSLSVKQDEN